METNRSPRKEILLSSAALVLMTVLLKILGFGEKRVLTHFLGGGDDLDVFFAAFKISVVTYFVLRGILRPAVIPLLVRAKNESPEKARNLGFSLALVTVLAIGGLTFAGEIFTPKLVSLFAEGFPAEKQLRCVQTTRWLLPASIAMSLSQLLAISLQVQKRFVSAALGECIQKGAFIVAVAIWLIPFGPRGLAGACWTGCLCMFAYYVITHVGAFHLRGRLSFSGQGMVQTSHLAWPLVVGSLVSQAGRLVQNRFASTLDSGSVTALTLAQTTVDLPLILVPLSLSIVLFPYFSEFSDRKEMERSFRYLSQAARFLLITFAPVTVCAYLFREPIAALLWKSGKLTEESIRLTSDALAGFVPGLPFMALEMVFMVYFYAHRRMVLAMVCGLVSTGLALAFLPFMTQRFQLAGVSAFLPLARAVKIGLLIWCLRFLDARVPWGRCAVFLAKLAGAVLLALAVHGLVSIYLLPAVVFYQRYPLIACAVSNTVLLGVYVVGLKLVGLREYAQIMDAIGKTFRRVSRESS